MRWPIKWVTFLIMLFIFLFINIEHCKAAFTEKSEKRVLILNSYDQKDIWEQSILKAIQDSFQVSKYDVKTNIEYMDTRQFRDDEYYAGLAQFFKVKYKDLKFDSIVTCDNDAFDFISKYHDEVFGDTPVVFCGVNHFDNWMAQNRHYITGITENVNIKNTMDIALKLHKDVEEVFVVTDDTTTGTRINSYVHEISSGYENRVKINFNYSYDINALISEIQTLPKHSVILLLGGSRNSVGEFIPMNRCAEIISEKSQIPIYGSWDFCLDSGVTGGMMTTGKYQGKGAADITLRILNGEKPLSIPIIKAQPDTYMFNYNKLKQYNILLGMLPKNSELINMPKSFYSISKKIIWGISIIILFILIYGIIKIIKNIKRRKYAEKAFKENEERLRTLINALPDVICFKDGEGRWMESNDFNLKLFNIDKIDYRGMTNSQLAKYSKNLGDRVNYFDKTDKAAWDKKSVLRYEETVVSYDENIIIFDTIKVPLFYKDGRRKGLVILGRDITEQKKNQELKIKAEENKRLLEEAMQYDKLKTEFFANISHELRTPLNVMLSTIQLLELYRSNGSISDNGIKLDRKMYILRQNSFRLLRLVNNLIDITKIDSGYYELQLINNDIVSVVENITLSVVEYVESKNISLVFDTDVEEKIIACDSDKIERIMLNLLSNAVKFTEPGGKISVNMYDGKDKITIVVSDTGIGIPKEKQQLIFERFRQVDKSLNRINEGSGIGLSLVESLIKMHEGSIRVESECNKGSKFIIELPAKVLPEQEVKTDNYIKSQEGASRTNLEFSDIL